MSLRTSSNMFLLIALYSLSFSLFAETSYYSGGSMNFGEESDESSSQAFQAELNFARGAVTGQITTDKTKQVLKLEGHNKPNDRLFLKVFSKGTHWADIKLVKQFTGKNHYAYTEGTIHWVGFIFRNSGQREPLHLVATDSMEKHPVFTSWDYLPSIAYFMNISYNPEIGKKIVNLMDNESIGTGLDGTNCIANGIPWLDCKLNYHPVDGCYLTEPQRNLCRQGPFDQVVNGITGNCWSFPKGPGLQLPFQQPAKSAFDLTKVELVQVRAITAKAQKVTATNEQIESSENFLNRPVCESAFAWGPTCHDAADGNYECF